MQVPTTNVFNSDGKLMIVNTSDVEMWRERGWVPEGEKAPDAPPAETPDAPPASETLKQPGSPARRRR